MQASDTLDCAEPKHELVRVIGEYRVVQVAYDEYQLHDLMGELRINGRVRARPFPPGADLNIADKQLYDLMRDRRIGHCGPEEIRQHLPNANAKTTGDRRMRIVKRSQRLPVDAAVALSMATDECLQLDLWVGSAYPTT
jgi:phage terminase large subunit-like protein